MFISVLRFAVATLSEYFEEYGKLKDVVVKRDPSTLESKGFAFIKYEDPSVVLNVLEDQDKNGHYIDDKRVRSNHMALLSFCAVYLETCCYAY